MFKGLAVPVEQEKSEIIDLTESFNSSCCLSEGELEEGEIKSPVKRTKNGSSLSKSRSSFQLNSEPRKLTKIISAPNLTTKSILKGKSVNIATLLKANQSKSKVTFFSVLLLLSLSSKIFELCDTPDLKRYNYMAYSQNIPWYMRKCLRYPFFSTWELITFNTFDLVCFILIILFLTVTNSLAQNFGDIERIYKILFSKPTDNVMLQIFE